MSHERWTPRLLSPVALVVASAALAGAHRGSVVVEDFERFTWGGTWATVHFSPRADPRMHVVREDVRTGEQACRLDVPPGETLTLITQHGTDFVGGGDKRPLPLPGVPERVGVWVRGAKSGHRLWMRLLDATGRRADLALGQVDFEGWRLLEARAPKLTPPVGLRGLSVRGGDGPLVLDDVTVTTTAECPLVLAAGLDRPDEEPVAGRVRLWVSVQSLAEAEAVGRGRVAAFAVGSPESPVAGEWFRYRVAAGERFDATVSLRLAAGVYELVARLAGAECRRRLVVFPRRARNENVSARRAVRHFRDGRDALRLTESALSPAVVVEVSGRTLTMFRALPAVGLTVPGDSLMRVKTFGRSGERREVVEPWLLLWFGASPAWYGVRFADGSPCPTFDVPFLVVFEERPQEVKLDLDGLRVEFARRVGRVAVMPLHGVRRPPPSHTSRWKEDVERIREVAEVCRFWARALRAVPIGVERSFRLDVANDAVEVRERFEYLELPGEWEQRPLRVAPVPPLLALAAGAGLPVSFSAEPKATGLDTAVGPYAVVPDAEEVSYTIRGVLGEVNRAVADVPAAGPDAFVGLERRYWGLASDAAKIPFWARTAGERGRGAAEALLRFMLWRENAHYELGAASGRLRAFDGLAWQKQGEEAAASAAADLLRGCWYGGFHAERWDLLGRHWHQIQSLRETLRPGGDWATLGLGAGATAFDARLNAELFFARLAGRLGHEAAYADGCQRLARLFVAGYALIVAPPYAQQRRPWPTLLDRPDEQAPFGRVLPGSLGLAPGPMPFVTSPSDAGYGLLARFLSPYFREQFRSGPLGFYGKDPAAWRQRTFAALEPPPLSARFLGEPVEPRPYAGNYLYTVQPGKDGWPTLAWRSHQAPKGGPLVFGTIGGAPEADGKLRRSLDVTPWLRLSAYEAIEGQRPPKAQESPVLREPIVPRGAEDVGRPGRSPR